MGNKTVIGDVNAAASETQTFEKRAIEAEAALTMMQRRVRTFHSEISFVQFDDPDTAPAWAEDWFEWLLTGEVPTPERPEVVESDDEASGD